MRKLSLALALLVAPALQAQGTAAPAAPPAVGRVGPMGPMGPGGDVASFLLSHTGELELSDQQVTRLAAIARRSADRRQAAMRSMDSAMARGPRRDSAGRGRFAPSPELRATAQRMRDQRHSDLRDALGVLTPDQQATAWELSAMRGGAWMARGPMPGGFGRRGGPPGPGSRFRGGPFPRGDGRGGAREAPGNPGPGV